MSHGIKNFLWRNGRPRWHPAPGLRAKGAKGKDLKDEAGHWLPLVEARNAADALNAAAGVLHSRVAVPANKEQGYVYFLFTDTEKVKIGFSTRPGSRLANLATAMESVVDFMIIVKGTRADEEALHAQFFKEHCKHEWFFASRRIVNTALASAVARRIDLGEQSAENPT